MRAENEVLRRVLSALLRDDKIAVASRFAKEADCPAGGEYSLGYLACAGEVSMRINENHSEALGALIEKGIIL